MSRRERRTTPIQRRRIGGRCVTSGGRSAESLHGAARSSKGMTDRSETGLAPFLVYVAGATLLVLLSFFAVPRSTGIRFQAIWTSAVLLGWIGVAWLRTGWLGTAPTIVLAWVLVGAQMVYPLFGLSMLAFTGVWLVGWSSDRSREGPRLPLTGRNLAGALAGILFVLVALGISASQLSRIPEIDRFRRLDPTRVERIVLVDLGNGTERHVVEDPKRIAAIVETLRSTFPYPPDHESVDDAEPWRMTVVLTGSEPTESLVIGAGTRGEPEAVFLRFDDDRGTFQNLELRAALRSAVPALADW